MHSWLWPWVWLWLWLCFYTPCVDVVVVVSVWVALAAATAAVAALVVAANAVVPYVLPVAWGLGGQTPNDCNLGEGGWIELRPPPPKKSALTPGSEM